MSKFQLIRETYVKEVGGTLYEYVHEDCGAKFLHLKTEDENKLFSISFQTVPENDTGVFHILEHSVLCGSEKYPVKEPLVALLKGSMQTFLNALTFSDKTMYPVASRNEKDLYNMASVYLDAVFRPNLLKEANIFYQEGWHYDFDENKEPCYSGVVYSEMTGVEASLDSKVMTIMEKHLFKDSCYGKVSGGETAHIPDLTYEEYVNTYRRFYNPSNAVFYLEGDIETSKIFEMVEEYVAGTPKTEADWEITEQDETEFECIEDVYEISESESKENRTQLAYGILAGSYEDSVKNLALHLLCDYLTDSNEAPLCKAIFDKELAQDIGLWLMDGTKQPYIMFQVMNTEADKRNDIENAIGELFEELCLNGIDKNELEASLDRMEFKYRESNEPKALYHNILVLNSLLYGGKPELYLSYDKDFEFLRAMLKTDYYEKLIDEILHKNKKLLVLRPVKQGEIEDDNEVKCDLARDEIEDLNGRLVLWQQLPDSSEDIAKIPSLSIEDIDPRPMDRKFEVKEVSGSKCLLYPAETGGIVYTNLWIRMEEDCLDKLATLTYLPNILGQIATKKHSLAELNYLKKRYMGSLRFEIQPFKKINEEGTDIYLSASFSALEGRFQNALALIIEILTETDFGRSSDIETLLKQCKENFRNNILEAGHLYATRLATAPLGGEYSAKEMLEGIHAYDVIKRICDDQDCIESEFTPYISSVLRDSLSRSGITCSITYEPCNEEKKRSEILNCLEAALLELPEKGKGVKARITGLCPKEDVVISIPSGVAYASIALDMGEDFEGIVDGRMMVASKIVSLEYLWNEVRVRQGAYGTGMQVNSDAKVMFYSYRDPKPAGSLEIYKRAGQFLSREANRNSDYTDYIISTISSYNPLCNEAKKSYIADTQYFRGLNYEMRYKNRREMLEINFEYIREFGENLKARLTGDDKDFVTAVVCGNKSAEEFEKKGFKLYTI